MDEKIKKGSDTFVNMKKIFEIMMVNMDKTRKSLNGISESTRLHSEKALKNIGEINELLEITNRLKNETENLGRDSKNIESSISLLNTSSENLKTGNVKLTGEIKNMVKVSDEVSGNFKAIFDSIRELDSKISLYKTE
jgi:methyl-accepting chemotaxis protein